MQRIDISRLRKDNGLSQSELAQKLHINQSFLSAIERGKSPLPLEKEQKLRDIFPTAELNKYIVEIENDKDKEGEKERTDTADMSESELITLLLTRFHEQAHQHNDSSHHDDHHQRIKQLEAQTVSLIEYQYKLMERNESLAERNDELRNENDCLRVENFRLKELLLNAGIKIQL